MRGSGRSLSCEGVGNATGLTIVKRSRSSTSHYRVVLFTLLDDFSLNISFTNSRLSHKFMTIAQIHNFCMSSYVDFSGFHDFHTNDRTIKGTRKQAAQARIFLFGQLEKTVSQKRSEPLIFASEAANLASLGQILQLSLKKIRAYS